MSARRRFYEVVSEAVADLVEHGFDSQERIDRWLVEIRRAAQLALVPEAEIGDFLRKSLGRVFLRATSTAALRRKHREIPAFTLEQVKPSLHAELRRRIASSANLIKLNRAASIERTLQRFAGWASSVPIGGSDVTSRKETSAAVRRSIAGLPFEERRVVVDQGHKLAASVNDIVARDGGAIALTWHHVKEGPPAYASRPDHVARDGKVYLLRDSWAVKDGLVKPAGHQYYDEITAVGEEVSCRCFAEYIYSLSALPPEMLTDKGKAMLASAAQDGVPHAAGVLLRTADNRALFLKRAKGDHAGKWALPAGKIEDGETPEQAARRETEEETGHIGNDPLVQVDEGSFVTFRQDVEEFEPQLNDEHTEFRWAPMGAPPEPLHPGVAATLEKLEIAEASKAAEVVANAAMREAHDRREYDTNGWFEVKDNPLSKVGVYPYRESSVIKGGDPKKMVGVYRPAEELGSEECINSFKLMPWTDDHPSTLLGPAEDGLVPAEKKGVHGVIGEQVYFRNGTLYGNIKVFSESLAKKIAAGKRELSCGYHCDFVPQEGVFEGKPYQYVQRKMRGNHFSSVDKGRMGSEVRVLDSAEDGRAGERFTFSLDMGETMPDSKRDDEAKGAVDADTLKFIGDSFNSLVGELERKGYSKEYATKIAGKVAAEKGMTGHHDSADSKVTAMADKDTKTEEERKKEAADRRAARDAKRAARDARRAKDEMTEEEEGAEDAAECAEDAEEEKEDEKDESKEARDRKSARDRRAGARDARKGARDRRAARDAKGAKDKALDAAAVSDLVKREVTAATSGAMDESKVAAIVKEHTTGVRRDAANAQRLYGRLSPIIGAFDHDEMSTRDMAVYGLKKLGQTAAADSADPITALDCYLAARGERSADVRQRSAQDGSTKADSFVGKYLAA